MLNLCKVPRININHGLCLSPSHRLVARRPASEEFLCGVHPISGDLGIPDLLLHQPQSTQLKDQQTLQLCRWVGDVWRIRFGPPITITIENRRQESRNSSLIKTTFWDSRKPLYNEDLAYVDWIVFSFVTGKDDAKITTSNTK